MFQIRGNIKSITSSNIRNSNISRSNTTTNNNRNLCNNKSINNGSHTISINNCSKSSRSNINNNKKINGIGGRESTIKYLLNCVDVPRLVKVRFYMQDSKPLLDDPEALLRVLPYGLHCGFPTLFIRS